jgi:SAM-dependent methyltransferase
MGLNDEIESYSKAEVSVNTGEIELWDHVIFPNVIRKRQNALILREIERCSPGRILDYGCGAGWLSKIIHDNDRDVIGIDASAELIKNANKAVPGNSFIVGDCVNLPFADNSFDFIIGSAILHHLNPQKALLECRRVMSPGGTLILMEPNKFNPPAAIGRRLVSVQTQDENPFTPGTLLRSLSITKWEKINLLYLFPYSFTLSFLFNKLGLGNRQSLKTLCPPIRFTERIIEKIPALNRLSYLLYVTAIR